MPTVHLRRPAMGSEFAMWLVGDDAEHLEAVGHAAWEEIARVERLLSRFDPTAEIARVNRLAAAGPVLVDYELFAVLEDCGWWWGDTGGFFDVCAGSGVRWGEAVRFDASARTVEFLDDRAQIDLGGYGKGYAIDAAGRIFERFGVSQAFMHGGTSSVFAWGVREDGLPWPVGIRDLLADEERELQQLSLTDCGLSTSAVRHREGEASDILDASTGQPLTGQAACVVMAPTALEAEVLSTALLAMGKSRARKYLEGRSPLHSLRVLWLEPTDGRTTLDEIYPNESP